MRYKFLGLIGFWFLAVMTSHIAYATSTCWDGSIPEEENLCPPPPIIKSDVSIPECPIRISADRFHEIEIEMRSKLGEVTETVVVPPEYEWVDGEFRGTSIQHFKIPATYKTITETVVVRPKCYLSIVDENGVTKQDILPELAEKVRKRVIVSPERVEKRLVLNLIKNGKTRITVKPSHIYERVLTY